MKKIWTGLLCIVLSLALMPMNLFGLAAADGDLPENTQSIAENADPAAPEDSEYIGDQAEGGQAQTEEEKQPEPIQEEVQPAEEKEPEKEEEKTEPAKEKEPEKEENREEPSVEVSHGQAKEESDAAEEGNVTGGTEEAEDREKESPVSEPDVGQTVRNKEEQAGDKNKQETEPSEQEGSETVPADVGFQQGYVRISGGEKLYKNVSRTQTAGKMKENAVAYAAETDERTGSVSLVLALNGEAFFAWVSTDSVEMLTETEQNRQENGTADLFWGNKAWLKNAEIELAEEQTGTELQNETKNREEEKDNSSEDGGKNPANASEENGEESAVAGNLNDEDQPEQDNTIIAPEEESSAGETADEEEQVREAVTAEPDEGEEIETRIIQGEGEYHIPENRPIPPLDEEGFVGKDSEIISPPESFYFYSPETGEIYPCWSAAADSYYEMRRKEDNGSWTVLGSNFYCSTAGNYYVGDSKTEGKVYQYAIRTWDSTHTSCSSWIKLTVFYTGTVSASAQVNSKTAVPTVKWGKATGATAYYIYRKETNRYTNKTEGWKRVKTISGNTTFSYADKSIAINRHYDYRIVPVRRIGNKNIQSYYKGNTSANVRPLSGAPGNLMVKQEANGVKITWDKVSGAKGYTIYYTNNPYAAKPTWKKLVSTTKTSYVHKDKVTPEKSGFYRRYRVCPTAEILGKVQNGPVTNSAILIRLASTTVKLAKGSEEDTVTVSWTKVKGANQYRISYKLDGESSFHYAYVDGEYTAVKLTAAQNISGTKKHLIYVAPVSTSNKTGKTQVGSKSATKSITPYWYRVLISYNDYYPDMTYYQNLVNKGKTKDMKGLKKVFSNQSVKLKTVQNASYSELASAISSAFGSATENTVCIFCFTGHGVSDSGYATGSLGYPNFTLLPSELKSLLDSNVPSNHVVLMISACGSGGLIKGGETEEEEMLTAYTNAWIRTFEEDEAKHGELATGRKYSVMTSADLYHNSYSTYNGSTGIGNYSYFMRGVCRGGGYDYYTGTNTGKLADKDKNGKVTFNELFSYVRNYAKNQTKNSDEGPQVAQKYTKEPDLIIFP